MKSNVFLLLSSLLISHSFSADPTNYEYFTNGGIKSGLKADSEHFPLNGNQITLFSGSLHYFRLPQQYWTDRLQKFRAGGLNTVQTYAKWNLHEETPGNFDFETGFLNLAGFLKAAKEADLFVVFRVGPYICAEWELGGYPAWLIGDPQMGFRSNYKPYLNAVEKYFNKILSILNEYQFTKGGPIIALQFENEFGRINNENDREYFQFMKVTIAKSGFREFLINCGSGGGTGARAVKHILKDVLETINFNSNSLQNLKSLRDAQPKKPLHVTEFWPGWFDQWGEKTHHRMTIEYFNKEVTYVLFNANSRINFYMYFGGTNLGFTNGGNFVTSYDYNCPLSESGNYTDKYWKAKELFAKLTKTHIPQPPKVESAANYGNVEIKNYLSFEDLLSHIKPIESAEPKHMELLNIGPNYGQNFGFILYRVETNKFKHLTINSGVSGRGMVLIDDKEVVVIGHHEYKLNTADSQFANTTKHKLDVLVENTGRVNRAAAMNTARKGLNGDVVIDDKKVPKYEIFPMEFKQKFVESLKQMKGRALDKANSPSLFRTELHISDTPRDTFLRLGKWTKRNVFVNGFNIGRYYNIGPQKTLYIPAPLLKTGSNDIYIFKLHSGSDKIDFVDTPDLGK